MEILNEDNENLWEKFTRMQENFSPQHSLGWKKSIEKEYKNCVPRYLLNKNENGNIETIFPFFLIESKIFGNKLISLPFIDFGGPIGKIDNKFLKEILNYIKKNEDISKVEIRLNDFMVDYKKIEKNLINNGFKKEFKKNQFILQLRGEEELWNDFNRITRKGIKKAKKSNLQLKEINNEEELKSFYKLYFNNMKNFGTPQHSYNFFNNLRGMKKEFKGLNCYKEDKLIGSLIILCTKHYSYAAYNVSDRKFLIYQPNDLIHWEMIRWCMKKGIKYFDFGQCDASSKEGTHAYGIYKFKKKWGGKLYNRCYFYYEFDKKDKIESIKKERDLLTNIWGKLPSSLIKIIGPKIASQLGI